MTDRKAELQKITEKIENKEIITALIDDMVFWETEMDRLKKMPQIKCHPLRPEIQKITPAAKLFKEYSQSYMNAIRIIIGLLRNDDTDAAAELMKKLEEI